MAGLMRKLNSYQMAAVVAAVAALALFLLYRADVIPRLGLFGDRNQVAPITLSGNIEAHESQLSFKAVQSRVVQLPFDEGQWVKQGTIVAVVDNQDLKQQVSIADAALTVQQRQVDAAAKSLEATRRVVEADRADVTQRELDLQRAQDLQAKGFVSAAALDTARTAVTQSKAILARDEALEEVAQRNIKVVQASSHSAEQSAQLSRIMESYSTLRAPFDGVIVARQAELGEVVAPGTPIVTIADLDHVWLRAYLNEADIGRVRLGQSVTVTTDTYPDKPVQGRISFISSQAEYTPKSVETHAERVTLVYRVKIDIDNPDHVFVPGMPADARLVPVATK
jgi:HlyD family secretion protein